MGFPDILSGLMGGKQPIDILRGGAMGMLPGMAAGGQMGQAAGGMLPMLLQMLMKGGGDRKSVV